MNKPDPRVGAVRPCPACGKVSDELQVTCAGRAKWGYVGCQHCDIEMEFRNSYAQDSAEIMANAIARWNDADRTMLTAYDELAAENERLEASNRASDGIILEQTKRIEVLESALRETRKAIGSVPADTFGEATVQDNSEQYKYPLQDELLYNIDAALSGDS